MQERSWIWLELFSYVVILIGALNWGLVGAFKVNLVDKVFGKYNFVIYILVGLAAVFNLFQRDYYLPFLGRAVYPCGSLEEKTPKDADVAVTVHHLKPNVNVIFWAAEPSNEIVRNPWLAYSKNANAGVTRADINGSAILRVRNPASYQVPSGRVLKQHIHYRVCSEDGMLSRVETVYL